MIGGAAVGWPLGVQAQQRDRLRRLGVLMGSENNPISQTLTAAFLQGLGALNWHEGGNLRIDWRWAGGDLGLFERHATELVGLDPDVLVANGSKGRRGAAAKNQHDPDHLRDWRVAGVRDHPPRRHDIRGSGRSAAQEYRPSGWKVWPEPPGMPGRDGSLRSPS